MRKQLMDHLRGALCLLMLATALLGSLCRADFSVVVRSPADQKYKKGFGKLLFSELAEIISIQTPMPNLILGDTANKAQLIYSGSLPNCYTPMTVIGKKSDGSIAVYHGNITLQTSTPLDLKNAVVVKGSPDSLTTLVSSLSDYTPAVMSNEPSGTSGINTMAIVLRESSGSVIISLEAESIVQSKIYEVNKGLAIDKPDCYPSCRTVCRSVMQFGSSTGSLPNGEIKDQNVAQINLGKPDWHHICGKDALRGHETCWKGTCGAGGSCKKNFDATDYGVCECPNKANERLGPKCQTLTRSYLGFRGDQRITTKHKVADDNTQPEDLTLTFQFAGFCQNNVNDLCTIVQVESSSNILIEVKLGRVEMGPYTTAKMSSHPKNQANTSLFSNRVIQQGMWLDVSLVASLNSTGEIVKVVTVVCTIETDSECFEQIADGTMSRNLTLNNAIVSLGGSFNGCIRNVRLGGRIVDLKVDSHEGPIDKTSDTCNQQDGTCKSGSSYTCGDKAVCYGYLGGGRSDNCRCECIGNTRMTAEKITNPFVCAASCDKNLMVFSTKSNSAGIIWAMPDGSSILLPSPRHVKVLLSFRTSLGHAPQLLKLNAVGSGALPLLLKIEDETLHCCLGSSCYAFVPKPVSDGFWHEVAVHISQSLLHVRIDDYSRVHVVSSNSTLITAFTAIMELPNSCITGVRISDIHIPTGSSDMTQDDSTNTIQANYASSGVSVGSKCA